MALKFDDDELEEELEDLRSSLNIINRLSQAKLDKSEGSLKDVIGKRSKKNVSESIRKSD